MVDRVEIPLQWANNIPGVSGVVNPVFRIPQVDDLEAAIRDLVPDVDDIAREVEGRIDDLQTTFDLTQDAIDRVVEDVVDELTDAIDIPEFNVDAVVDALVDRIEEVADPIVDSLETAVQDLLADVEQGVTGIELDPDALADSLAARIDPGDIAENTVRFEGIFGPLTEDIVDGLETVLQDLLDAVDEGIPSLEDLDDLLREVLADVGPEVNGVQFFEDPVEFVIALGSEAVDRQVSDETRQALQDDQP